MSIRWTLIIWDNKEISQSDLSGKLSYFIRLTCVYFLFAFIAIYVVSRVAISPEQLSQTFIKEKKGKYKEKQRALIVKSLFIHAIWQPWL